MEMRKEQIKRKIEWLREDIKWSEDMGTKWREFFTRHIKKKHGDKPDKNCEICVLWRDIIDTEKANAISMKQEIRGILRGE